MATGGQRGILVGVALALVAVSAGAAFLVIRSAGDQIDRGALAKADFLADPSAAGELIRGQFGDDVQLTRLALDRSQFEVHVFDDGASQRYSLSPRGDFLRRGSASPASGDAFGFDQIYLGDAGRMVASAAASGTEVTAATLERDDSGALVWTVIGRADGVQQTLRYGVDGVRLAGGF